MATTLWSCPSHARDAPILLYDSLGRQVSDYRDRLNQLREGDVIEFGDGLHRFQFVKRLGSGRTTEVVHAIELGPQGQALREVALRVPLLSGRLEQFEESAPVGTYQSYITSYRQARSALLQSGVRIPELYSTYRDQFLAVELLAPDSFNAKDFMIGRVAQSASVMEEAERKLYEFSRNSAAFSSLSGDFEPGALFYDVKKREWILIDFMNVKSMAPLTRARKPTENPLWTLRPGSYEKLTHVERDRANRISDQIQVTIRQWDQEQGPLILRCAKRFARQFGPRPSQ